VWCYWGSGCGDDVEVDVLRIRVNYDQGHLCSGLITVSSGSFCSGSIMLRVRVNFFGDNDVQLLVVHLC